MRTRFDTSSFRRSHGRQPKGFGTWGFFFGADAAPAAQRNPWFTPRPMSFSDAKKAAAQEAHSRGQAEVAVAP